MAEGTLAKAFGAARRGRRRRWRVAQRAVDRNVADAVACLALEGQLMVLGVEMASKSELDTVGAVDAAAERLYRARTQRRGARVADEARIGE